MSGLLKALSGWESLLRELEEEGLCSQHDIKEIQERFPDGLDEGWQYEGNGMFKNENEEDNDYRYWYVCGCCWCCGHRTDCKFDYHYQQQFKSNIDSEVLKFKLERIYSEVGNRC